MSLYTTPIDVGLDAVKAKLPPRAFVHSVKLSEDHRTVLLTWDCDEWTTPYSVPVEISQAMLDQLEPLPSFLKLAAGCKRVQTPKIVVKPGRVLKRDCETRAR